MQPAAEFDSVHVPQHTAVEHSDGRSGQKLNRNVGLRAPPFWFVPLCWLCVVGWQSDCSHRERFGYGNNDAFIAHHKCELNSDSQPARCPPCSVAGFLGGDVLAVAEAVIANLDMSTVYEKVCLLSNLCQLLIWISVCALQRVYDFNDAVRSNGGFTETAPYVGIAE
jgi:hypothetical protein